MSSTPHSNAHETDCCADIFEAKSVAAGTAAETQKAFGALMRSVQPAGTLSEKLNKIFEKMNEKAA